MTQTLRFDGVNDHVTIPTLPDMTGNWQMEFKVIIRANANTVIAGDGAFTRFIELRVPASLVRVRGVLGTSYDVPCPMTLGETCTILITSTVSPARLTVFKNGVQVGQVTFTQGIGGLIYLGRNGTSYGSFDLYSLRVWDGTVDRNYSADGITSGTVLPDLNNSANNGTLVNFSATPWVNDELFTLPATITPGSSFTSTVISPYIDGAATITFGTVVVAVTIAGGQFTTSMPMFSDGALYPKIPLTTTVTLTQGANTSTIFRPFALPVGYMGLKDGDGITGNYANFANIVIDDDEYIGKWFNDASNPLTINDTVYWQNAGGLASTGLAIYQDGSYSLPVGSAPISTTLNILRGADNKVYLHPATFSEDAIEDIGAGLTAVGLTSPGLTARGLTGVGL